MSKVWAIIVAAGQGRRMNDPVRKQYHTLSGLPVVVHTLRVFDACSDIDEIIFCVPARDIDYCRDELISPANLNRPVAVVAGGPTRQESVFNGLQAIDANNGIAVIHDGVRPFVSADQITACLQGAAKHGACILGIPAFDTLKHVNEDHIILETVKRDTVWMAQTPQAFRYDLIAKAHQHARQHNLRATDDASLLEHIGVSAKIIPGSRLNLKITDQDDLKLARILLRHRPD
jgi:2-C-methyl-D-erythritol 4-phosphate cytidylyltransferase